MFCLTYLVGDTWTLENQNTSDSLIIYNKMASQRKNKILNFRAIKGWRDTSSTLWYCSLSTHSWLHKQNKDETNII